MSVQNGLAGFPRRFIDNGEPLLARQRAPQRALALRQMADAVLDDDDGTVDDDAEIERPQAHQVRADVVVGHARHREQHRQGDDQCRDDGRAHIAEQHEEHSDDQRGTFKQVLADGGDGPVHQRGAVVDRFGHDAGGKAAVDLRKLLCRARRDGAAVLANEHEYCAQHHFLPVLGGCAVAQLLPQMHRGNVPDADRRAAAGVDHDRCQLFQAGYLAG
ncbi:hypothetical protein D9M70_442060 [compost metagenome]